MQDANRIAELEAQVKLLSEQVAVLTQTITKQVAPTTPTASTRKTFLKKVAVLALGGAAASGFSLASPQTTQAKLSVNPNPNIATLSTLPSATVTGSITNTDNKYSLVGSADTTFNLADLPVEASVGVVGLVQQAAGGAGGWFKVQNGWGLRAECSGTGFGLSATAVTGTAGGFASDTGTAIYALSNSGVPILIEPSAQVPTLPQGVTSGAFYVDGNGDLNYLKGGVWKKITLQ